MNVLVIAPHPDDEAIGCGGAILKHAHDGDDVFILHLTAGEAGIPDADPEHARTTRRLEALDAARLLGAALLDSLHWPDGFVPTDEAAVARLRSYIAGYDVVYVTHAGEDHADHAAAAKLVTLALEDMEDPPQVWTYEVWTPQARVDRLVDISDYIDQKQDAIEAHASQVALQHFSTAARGLAMYRAGMAGRSMDYAEAYGRLGAKGQNVKIAVCMFTYAESRDHYRAGYARTTWRAALQNLQPGPGVELVWHIADDGSPRDHIDDLLEIAHFHDVSGVTVSNSERRGYGASYNAATSALHGPVDMVLCLEDDWQLMRPLELSPLARAIEASAGTPYQIDCVRLGYLGWTQELYGGLVQHGGMSFLLLDHDSPEPHVFAGHPRLETVARQREIGVWPEGLRAGTTEWEVAHRQRAREGVAWPLDLGMNASQDYCNTFAHIGAVQA